MKNILKPVTLSLTLIFLAATSPVSAGAMFNPFNGLGNSGLSNMEREYLINNPEKSPSLYSPVCFGCFSSTTGLPRTEYVRPHFGSNGTYVDGSSISRRK